MARKRKPKRPAGDAVRSEVLGFLESARVDKAADYMKRGRSHARLTDGALAVTWMSAMQAMADNPTSRELRTAHDDLQAEFDLRGLDAPWGAAEDAVNKMVAAANSELTRLKKDPDAYAQLSLEFGGAVAEFVARRMRKN